jgi:hypothetical protein
MYLCYTLSRITIIVIKMNLPTVHPAEALAISPEALEIANAYLTYQDTKKVSEELDIGMDIISNVLNRREVKAYINNVFMDLGFNNRFKLRKAMDAIIARKFQELDEADVGSGKDIADLLALSHKMTMDELDKQIQLEKIRETNIRSQVNVQINDGGSNYSSLLERIINADNK